MPEENTFDNEVSAIERYSLPPGYKRFGAEIEAAGVNIPDDASDRDIKILLFESSARTKRFEWPRAEFKLGGTFQYAMNLFSGIVDQKGLDAWPELETYESYLEKELNAVKEERQEMAAKDYRHVHKDEYEEDLEYRKQLAELQGGFMFALCALRRVRRHYILTGETPVFTDRDKQEFIEAYEFDEYKSRAAYETFCIALRLVKSGDKFYGKTKKSESHIAFIDRIAKERDVSRSAVYELMTNHNWLPPQTTMDKIRELFLAKEQEMRKA